MIMKHCSPHLISNNVVIKCVDKTSFIRFTLDLPEVPKIFVNGEHQHGRLAGPYDEGTDLNLSCEVAGKLAFLVVFTELCQSKELNMFY